MEFIETVAVPNKAIQKHNYFFKGFFKTQIND